MVLSMVPGTALENVPPQASPPPSSPTLLLEVQPALIISSPLLCCTGPRTVIHPKARIIAEAGPIIIGEGNLIEEQALIINA